MTQVKSASRYIREHLDDIEQQMQMGVYQEAICQELNQAGYSITLPAFRKAIMRARQRRVGQASKAAAQSPAIPVLQGKRLTQSELDQMAALQKQMSQASPATH